MNRKRRNSETEPGPSSAPSRPRINREHIFELVVQGKLQEILQEITDDSDLLMRDCDGRNLLHKAVGACYEQSDFIRQAPLIQHLISKAPQLMEERNIDGQTPLCLACQKILYFEMITLLIESNPSTACMADDNGLTPLHHLGGRHFYCLEDREDDGAYTNKDECLDLARLLVKHGADVNCEDNRGESPLHNTISKKDWTGIDYDMEMIELLLELGAKLCTKSGSHAISYANSIEQITFLLNIDKTDINKTDKKGWTPLHHIVNKNLDENIIKLLLENGARIENGINWLQLARNKRFKFDIIEYSLKNIDNCDVNTRDDFGYTILMIYGTSYDNIQKLIDLGADASLMANNGTNALFTVVTGNDLEAVKLLIENGVDPLVVDQDGKNILSIICEKVLYPDKEDNSYFEIAKYLFNLPVFNESSPAKPKFIPNFHPQSLILQNFHSPIVGTSDRAYDLLKLLIKSNCKDTSLLVKCPIQLCIETFYFDKSFLDPISVLLHSPTSKNYIFDQITKDALYLMLENGYTLSNTPQNSVTALTILLGTPEYPFDIVEDFISRGVNIKSTALEILHVYNNSARKIPQEMKLSLLKRKYNIPDALLVAFLVHDLRVLKLFLPYWVGPPLLLLVFNPSINNEVASAENWFKYLSQYGYIPHGTEMYAIFKNYIERLQRYHTDDTGEQLTDMWIQRRFHEYQQTPSSLRDLARCFVRLSMAQKVQESEKCLPSMLAEICPPGLKQYLLLQPDEPEESVDGVQQMNGHNHHVHQGN